MRTRSSGRIISETTLAATPATSASLFFLPPALAGAIHDAAGAGDTAQVEQLLATGTAVDDRDRAKKTALHWAADVGDLATAQLLVAEGADINAKDFSGLTPLHFATDDGHATVVELLLINGAEVNVLDKMASPPWTGRRSKNLRALSSYSPMLAASAGRTTMNPRRASRN